MDHVAHILDQWRAEKPGLDVSAMAVIGRISYVSALIDAHLAPNFARHGVDASTFDVLATLLRQGAPYQATPVRLAEESMITTSAVAQRLNRLETLGLIRREPNPADGRGKLVSLTPAGRDLVEDMLPGHLAAEEQLLARLSTEERLALADLLSRVATGEGS